MHGANGRQGDLAVQSSQLLANLRRPPARVFPLQPHNQSLDLKGKAISLPIGSAAAISQALNTAVQVAVIDLMTGFAGDIKLPTQHRHLLPIQQPAHESES